MATTKLSELISSFISTVHAEEATHVEEFILLSADINDDPPSTLGLADIIEDLREDTKSDNMLKECTKTCANLKDHLNECNNRVEKGSNEDCMEEFFHFMHCADECATPPKFLATTH